MLLVYNCTFFQMYLVENIGKKLEYMKLIKINCITVLLDFNLFKLNRSIQFVDLKGTFRNYKNHSN